MTHPSKIKGNNFERAVVSALAAHGIDAKRVPLSGSVNGYEGDIDCIIAGRERKLECKIRKRAFGTLYGFLKNSYAAVVRDDRTEPLVVMRLMDFAELAAKAGNEP